MSVDPVTMMQTGNPAMFNRYSYSFNDPVNMIDPNGETPVHAAIGIGYGVYRVGKAAHSGYKAYRAYRAARAVIAVTPSIGPEVTPTDDTASGSSVSSSEHPKDKLTSKDRAIAKRIFGQGPDGGDEKRDKIRDSGLDDDLLDDFTPDEIGDAMDKYENVADRAIDKANSGSMSDSAAENTRNVQGTRKEIIEEVRKELPK